MKINYDWLQEYIVEPLPPIAELAEKIIFSAFEVENTDEIKNGENILDIKTLPDRNHDCLGHYGMAREIAGILGLTLKPLEFKQHTLAQSDVSVTLKTNICNRYLARKILHVSVTESPDWLKQRLESIGARSINSVVDATNYVMFTLGQPIHAFDADKLANGKIVVRHAYDGEEMLTLDGKLVPLNESNAVITNDQADQPLAIAGVKGGKYAEVDKNTKNIIIEVANFDAVSVRKTAQHCGIHNDSTKRFENEITPFLCDDAMHLVTDLIMQLSGGQPTETVDEFPHVPQQRTVAFSILTINRLLGTSLSVSEMTSILDRFSYTYTVSGEEITLTVPHERIDIAGAHDMAEEIGKVYGYGNIQAVVPELDTKHVLNDSQFSQVNAIRSDLITQGYHEVITYTFCKKGDYEVARGPVGKSALRKNLIDGLKESFEMNRMNKDLVNVDDMKIFEIGSIFTKDGEKVLVGIADKQGMREMKLDEYVFKNQVSDAKNIKEDDAQKNTVFKPWSLYPHMTRDVAVWISESTNHDQVADILKKHGGDLLVIPPRLFDIFTKDGKTSVAFRMVFQLFDRTLTEEEITPIMDAIYAELKGNGWEIR